VSIALEEAVNNGRLIIQWQPAIEMSIDKLAAVALATVKQVGATRLVLDGAEGFRDSAMREGRFGLFLNAFSHQLREAGVTTLMTEIPLYAGAAHTRHACFCHD
jgi:circadian clock protein KaiC